MDTLIAEDLLLLLLDDEKGAVRAGTSLPTALGGAVLIELALAGAVAVEDRGRWRTAQVRVEDGAAPRDPVLVDALATVAEKERSAQDLATRLGKGLQDTLGDRLVSRGVLERREDKVLGVFPRTRWPAADSTHEDGVRRQVAAVLVEGADPDPRTGALVALLHALDQAHTVVDRRGMSAREVRERAQQVSEGAWAATAVRDAIRAAAAEVTAAVGGGG
uniref:GOLPH3/VPS74 family protein n=1 Tax=Nocardioides lijunqiniae TaxID=2760832 RepID=UPI001878ABF9